MESKLGDLFSEHEYAVATHVRSTCIEASSVMRTKRIGDVRCVHC